MTVVSLFLKILREEKKMMMMILFSYFRGILYESHTRTSVNGFFGIFCSFYIPVTVVVFVNFALRSSVMTEKRRQKNIDQNVKRLVISTKNVETKKCAGEKL